MRDLRVGPAEVAALAILAVVVVLVAIQVTGIARSRALAGEMTAKLESLALHQESYRRDRAVYSGEIAVLEQRGFMPDPRIRLEIREATHTGWSATATHNDHAVRCDLIVGDASPIGRARSAGQVACD